LTALGVYDYMVFVEYLRLALLDERRARIKLVWKMKIVPHVAIVDVKEGL